MFAERAIDPDGCPGIKRPYQLRSAERAALWWALSTFRFRAANQQQEYIAGCRAGHRTTRGVDSYARVNFGGARVKRFAGLDGLRKPCGACPGA